MVTITNLRGILFNRHHFLGKSLWHRLEGTFQKVGHRTKIMSRIIVSIIIPICRYVLIIYYINKNFIINKKFQESLCQ